MEKNITIEVEETIEEYKNYIFRDIFLYIFPLASMVFIYIVENGFKFKKMLEQLKRLTDPTLIFFIVFCLAFMYFMWFFTFINSFRKDINDHPKNHTYTLVLFADHMVINREEVREVYYKDVKFSQNKKAYNLLCKLKDSKIHRVLLLINKENCPEEAKRIIESIKKQ